MGCDLYEVGVRDPAKGMLIRTFTPEEVLRSVGWLKSQNARGADIYIRPAQGAKHGLVLVDDIEAEGLDQLQKWDLAPALVVETSPKNHQAWIKLQSPADDRTRRDVARHLARILDADPNSADARHFGRLAGFTNRKPDHTTDRGSPYVLLHDASGAPAPQAPVLVREAQAKARSDVAKAIRAAVDEGAKTIPPLPDGVDGVGGWYRNLHQRLQRDFGADFDASRADWMAAVALIRRGHSFETVAKVIEKESPGIDRRKEGHAADYVTRTAGKAEIWVELDAQGAHWEDVRDELLQMAQERQRERLEALEALERARLAEISKPKDEFREMGSVHAPVFEPRM